MYIRIKEGGEVGGAGAGAGASSRSRRRRCRCMDERAARTLNAVSVSNA